jgi:hypothetical protein
MFKNEYNKYFDIKEVLNSTLSSYLSSQIKYFLKSSNSLTPINFLKILSILFLEETKTIFINIIKILFNYFSKYCFKFTGISCNYLMKFFSNFRIISKKTCVNVKFTPSITFMQKMLVLVKQNNYEIVPLYDVLVLDDEKISYKQTWRNIKINFEDIEIKILSELIFTFKENFNNSNLIEYSTDNTKNNLEIDISIYSDKYNSNVLSNKFAKFLSYVNGT